VMARNEQSHFDSEKGAGWCVNGLGGCGEGGSFRAALPLICGALQAFLELWRPEGFNGERLKLNSAPYLFFISKPP
jgi:hypothetical protein